MRRPMRPGIPDLPRRASRCGAARALVVVLLLALNAIASPSFADETAPDITIRILEARRPARLVLTPEGGAWIRSGASPTRSTRAGARVTVEAARGALRFREGDGPSRTVDVLTVGGATWQVEGPGTGVRRYRGRLTLRCPPGAGGAMQVILGTDLEGYVASVVASEMPLSAPPQALQAQAVAVRSYAAALARLDRRPAGRAGHRPRGPHAEDGHDFCDLTHCQAFHGLPDPDSPAWDAARATRHRVLLQGGRLLAACYHSTCGGHTAWASDVLPALPLKGVADGPAAHPWCARSPHARWRAVVPATELRAALASSPESHPGATLKDVRVVRRTREGRAADVEIDGDRTRRMDAQELMLVLGAHLGWGRIESTWFTVRREGAAFVFEGRGLGHGLGLCQYGCMEMARRGSSPSRILAHYFPGARLADLEARP